MSDDSLATPGKQEKRWDGTVILTATRAIYLGTVRDTAVHAHHAVQVCIALREPFLLRGAERSRWGEYRSAVIGSDQLHQLDGRGEPLLIVYLEPETLEHDVPAILTEDGIQAPEALPYGSLRDELAFTATAESRIDPSQIAAIVDKHLDVRALERRPLDARIAQALGRLRAHPREPTPTSQLAASVGLSTSRFRHLFAAEVGISLRHFTIWNRLYAAVETLSRGGNLTEAAHDAGFSDSAHLSRSFRRMFGIAPSTVSNNVRLIAAADTPWVKDKG